MNKKYKYQGNVQTNLSGFGRVEPGQIIETDLEINHPLFREVKEKIIISKKKRK